MTSRRIPFPAVPNAALRRAGPVVVLAAMAAALFVLMLIMSAAAAADTAPARRSGIDSKPFPYNGVVSLRDQPVVEKEDGEARRELAEVRRRLSAARSPEERARLFSRAARLEAERGNRARAMQDAQAALNTGALTDLETAEVYRLLSRLHVAKAPPDFAKAVEYQRKANEIMEKQGRGRR